MLTFTKEFVILDHGNDTDPKQEYFTVNEKIHHTHTGVGSGVTTKDIFKSYDVDITDENIYTSGHVRWNLLHKSDSENQLVEKEKSINLLSTSLLNVKAIYELSKTYIDPQDPQNSLFYDYMTTIENVDQNKNFFRLEPNKKLFEFCDASEIDENPRFKMLRLRDKNEPEFQGVVVPNRIKEIPADAFVAYEKRCAENQSPLVPEDFRKDDIDAQRQWGLKYLHIAENKVIQLSKIAENKICLEDVLTENTIPSLG